MKAILRTSLLALAIMFVLGIMTLSALSNSKRSVVESDARFELKQMSANLGVGETDIELPADIILVTIN